MLINLFDLYITIMNVSLKAHLDRSYLASINKKAAFQNGLIFQGESHDQLYPFQRH